VVSRVLAALESLPEAGFADFLILNGHEIMEEFEVGRGGLSV
jgi:hypothetical protein